MQINDYDHILELIKSKYQLVTNISLLEHDANWEGLIDILYKLRDTVFDVDQRILIELHDTDYYPNTKGGIGNNIHNLFKLFSTFNIPCDKIIFLVTQFGIDKEIILASKTIANDAPPTVIYTPFWEDSVPSSDIIEELPEIENLSISHLYHCLNGKQRNHRLYMLCALKEENLVDRGVVSYHFGS